MKTSIVRDLYFLMALPGKAATYSTVFFRTRTFHFVRETRIYIIMQERQRFSGWLGLRTICKNEPIFGIFWENFVDRYVGSWHN